MNKEKDINTIGLILRGMAMGVAEVIPGVSGGTIAFITGIYERLINAIKAVDLDWIKALLKFRLRYCWEKVDGIFLIKLIAGMIGGIVIGIFGVSYLLEVYPESLWGFFFGLILASIPYMLKQINEAKGINWVVFLIGAVFAFAITSMSPAEGSTHPLYVFVAGAIAISALVLPGISGSFMLLLMGLYTIIIPALKSLLKSLDTSVLPMIIFFALGCATGLILFSRIVAAAFNKYHDVTIALMSGFLLGSLNKIWPWRNPIKYLNKDDNSIHEVSMERKNMIDFGAENIKVLQESNVFPQNYYSEAHTMFVLISLLLGLAVIYLLTINNKNKA